MKSDFLHESEVVIGEVTLSAKAKILIGYNMLYFDTPFFFRKFINTKRYKGPTKNGVSFSRDALRSIKDEVEQITNGHKSLDADYKTMLEEGEAVIELGYFSSDFHNYFTVRKGRIDRVQTYWKRGVAFPQEKIDKLLEIINELHQMTQEQMLESYITSNAYSHIQKLIRVNNDFLSQREEKMIRMRYGIDEARPYTQAEIAEKFDLSQSRISTMLKSSLDKLQ